MQAFCRIRTKYIDRSHVGRMEEEKLQFSELHTLATSVFLEEFCIIVFIQKFATHFITKITSAIYI